MFTHLIESIPGKRGLRGVTGTSVSLAFHGLLVWGAIESTRDSAIAEPTSLPTPIDISYEHPESPTEQPDLPVFGSFIIPEAPVVVPTEIPEIDSTVILDPELLQRTNTAPLSVMASDADRPDPGIVLPDNAVDERPEMIAAFAPEYPDLLRQAGIEGNVVVEVIIDTAGRAEPGTVRVIHSTHRAFEAPARDAVLKTRYRPGRVRGQAVRVLVQVPVAFAVRR